tara:strand:+ start:123 stop:479 length:357 start_codon:yes stop_codon:yes gene_type:complete
MRKCLLLLLLLSPVAARANPITPNFTQGSMQSTTTTTQTVVETIEQEVFGGAYSSWSGTNVSASGSIDDSGTNFTITTPGSSFQFETVTRAAGVVETIDTARTITTNATTTSLSVFSQ